jgi:UDP-glucuronate 4-epimerase
MRPASPDEATSASGGARIRPLTGRYLVTGCAGFIGSYLAEALLARGDSVVGVDAFTDYYPRTVKEENLAGLRARPGFSFVEADLARAPLGELVDVDGVFHLAAQPGVRGSWGDTFALYTRDNLLATQRVFEASAERGVRVVFASSSSVYGNAEAYPTREDARPRPISPYGVTKLSCEHLASAYAESRGLDHVALRYFTVYGPRQRPDMAFTRIVAALADGTPFFVYGTGEQSRDVTYVGDAVTATIAAMERGTAGALYNVGGGSETSLRQVISLFEHLSGRSLELRFQPMATGDVRRTSADTTAARADLGWEPKTSLEEGLLAQLAWGGLAV